MKIEIDESSETAVVRRDHKDWVRYIVVKNRGLLNEFLLKNEGKVYKKFIQDSIKWAILKNTTCKLLFVPEVYSGTAVLCVLLRNIIWTDYRILRSSEIENVIFGRSAIYKSLDGVKVDHLFIFLDGVLSDLVQSNLIGLLEKRRMGGKYTVCLTSKSESEFKVNKTISDYFMGLELYGKEKVRIDLYHGLGGRNAKNS